VAIITGTISETALTRVTIGSCGANPAAGRKPVSSIRASARTASRLPAARPAGDPFSGGGTAASVSSP